METGVYSPWLALEATQLATEGEGTPTPALQASQVAPAWESGVRRPRHERGIDVAAFGGGGRGQNSPQGRVCQGGDGMVTAWKAYC